MAVLSRISPSWSASLSFSTFTAPSAPTNSMRAVVALGRVVEVSLP